MAGAAIAQGCAGSCGPLGARMMLTANQETRPGGIVVVGASASGIGVALGLRAHGYAGTITLIGDELTLPYDRPPLSKGVLWGTHVAEDIALATAEEISEAQIDLILGAPASSLDIERKRIVLADGQQIEYETAIIATGASSRTLPQFDGFDNVITLRTWDDGVELQRRLGAGARLGIVGGGLIGLEVASSAVRLGVDVTVVEPTAQPLANRITPVLSEWLLQQHRDHGVKLHLNAVCTDVVVDGPSVAALHLSDGSLVPVDVVLVSVGAAPNVGWLEGSGLELDNGVVVDQFQRAAEDVYAVGDIANGYHPVYQRRMRMETRSNATEGADHLARTLTGSTKPYAPVPFFWTDQYDFKLQSFGLVAMEDAFEFSWGALEDGKWGLVGRRDGALTGFFSRGFGPQLAQHRRDLNDSFERSLEQTLTKGVVQ
ncbi:NAD(P)/FAD-dependent oxidoreductase [Microbacterium rhizomatis]|nr:FAD-dependent oxidoreductase [Microbacterium rhizomatis]